MRGTEQSPIVVRDDTESGPKKYQCPDCERWFVEGWAAVARRQEDFTDRTRCKSCHGERRSREWAEYRDAVAKEWAEFVPEFEPIPVSATITVEGRYRRRTFWEWLTRKPRQLQPFTVVE